MYFQRDAERVTCRYCLSSDRDRLVWLYLSNRIAESHTILHVAPELPISKAIRNHPNFRSITYECIDKKDQGYFYPSWVKNGDVTSLSYPNNHFDIIIANHVLEHIPDLRSVFGRVTSSAQTIRHSNFHGSVEHIPPHR